MAYRIDVRGLSRSIPAIDHEFSDLLAEQAEPEYLSAFVVRNYLPVAYIFAHRIVRSHITEEDIDDVVAERAIEVIDDVVTKIRTGQFLFHGAARFSTYLWSALYRAGRTKRYVPTVIDRLGQVARRIYQLHYQEGRPLPECRQILRSESSVDEDTLDGEIQRVRAAVNSKPIVQSLLARRPAATIDPTDPVSGPAMVAEGDPPEQAFLKATLVERVEQALADLSAEDRQILELHYVAGMSIRAIGRRLRLKSPQYRFSQARDHFVRMAGDRDIEALFQVVSQGAQHHG